MMSTSQAFLQTQPTTKLGQDGVDLIQLSAALVRQKILIGSVTFFVTLLSGIYAITFKPVWQGSFQIVLEKQDTATGGRLAQLAAANPMLANLAGFGGSGKGSLETEVKILESPSVLKPIYEFVKLSKARDGQDVSKWTYLNWVKSSLAIELLKGTTVLNLTFQDTDKKLVLPVLDRISDTYQEYSGRDRRRGLTQALKYLEQQLTNLQEKSNQSMRAAQAYALNNGLGIQDGLPAQASSRSADVSVEVRREEAQNRVNALRQQIATAKRVGGERLYQAPQLSANTELYRQLQIVETKLREKSALLTQSDQLIQTLQRQRSSLTGYINQQMIDLLRGELLTAEAELASLTRPRDVVLKHRELVRTALRDENLLAELETQLQATRLDQARQTDPWELISTPTLLDKPVRPRKKRMVALGLLSGLFLGCGAGLVRDRRTGLVFSVDELKDSLPCPLLERLPAAAPYQWINTAHLLVQGPLANATSIALIPVGNLKSEQVEQLSQSLKNALGDRQLVLSSDLLATRNCCTQLLVTAPGVSQVQQLQQLRKQLALQGTPLAGWLLIDPEMEA